MPKCVYFIQQGDTGPIKIGFTAKFHKRFASIQAVNITVRLLGIMLGGRKEEHQMHERFKEYRLKGEWFHPVAEITEFARSLLREPPAGADPVVTTPIKSMLFRLKKSHKPPKPKLTREQRIENQKRGQRLAKQRRLEKINQPVTADQIDVPLEEALRGFYGVEFRIGPFLTHLGLEWAKQAYGLTRKRLLQFGWKRVLKDYGHGAVAESFTPPSAPLSWCEAYMVVSRDPVDRR